MEILIKCTILDPIVFEIASNVTGLTPACAPSIYHNERGELYFYRWASVLNSLFRLVVISDWLVGDILCYRFLHINLNATILLKYC